MPGGQVDAGQPQFAVKPRRCRRGIRCGGRRAARSSVRVPAVTTCTTARLSDRRLPRARCAAGSSTCSQIAHLEPGADQPRHVGFAACAPARRTSGCRRLRGAHAWSAQCQVPAPRRPRRRRRARRNRPCGRTAGSRDGPPRRSRDTGSSPATAGGAPGSAARFLAILARDGRDGRAAAFSDPRTRSSQLSPGHRAETTTSTLQRPQLAETAACAGAVSPRSAELVVSSRVRPFAAAPALALRLARAGHRACQRLARTCGRDPALRQHLARAASCRSIAPVRLVEPGDRLVGRVLARTVLAAARVRLVAAAPAAPTMPTAARNSFQCSFASCQKAARRAVVGTGKATVEEAMACGMPL